MAHRPPDGFGLATGNPNWSELSPSETDTASSCSASPLCGPASPKSPLLLLLPCYFVDHVFNSAVEWSLSYRNGKSTIHVEHHKTDAKSTIR
jgi:hypothetical protein